MHALVNREILKQGSGTGSVYPLVILLWLRSSDSEMHWKASEFDVVDEETLRLGDDFVAQLAKIEETPFPVLAELGMKIFEDLSSYQSLFDGPEFGYRGFFVNEKGIERLNEDWPEIGKELEEHLAF